MGFEDKYIKCATMIPDSNAEIEIDKNVVPKVSTPNINAITSIRSTKNDMVIKRRINKA